MEQRKNTLSTFIVMGCTALSRLFGYVKVLLIAAFFGGSGAADAINAAFNVPNSLRKIFAEGSLSSAFIPILSETMSQDPQGERSRRLVANLLSFLMVILVPLTLASILFPRQFAAILPFEDLGKAALSAELLRWMFSYILFVSLSAVIAGVLNSHGSFVVPALSPLMFSVAIIGALVGLRSLGPYAMAVGVVVGGVVQLLFLMPAFFKRGYTLAPDLRLRNPDFLHTMKLWIPFVVTSSLYTVNQLIAYAFASGLEDGSASALNYAITVTQLPVGIFSASVVTVSFPAMSRQASRKDEAGLKESVLYGVEFLLTLMIPSAIALCALSKEVVSVAFQRGAFDAEATLRTSGVLIGYAAGLVSLTLFTFLQRFFYAVKDYRTPLLASAVVVTIDVVLSLILKETPLRVAGLAYANTISFTVGLVIMAWRARKRLGRLEAVRILASLGKSLLASVPLTICAAAFRFLAGGLWRLGGGLRNIAVIGGLVCLCAALTILVYLLLGVPYIRELIPGKRRRA